MHRRNFLKMLAGLAAALWLPVRAPAGRKEPHCGVDLAAPGTKDFSVKSLFVVYDRNSVEREFYNLALGEPHQPK